MVCCLLWIVSFPLKAQQYTSMTGLLHVPSAEMNDAGTAVIGTHFLNKKMTPDGLTLKGEGKYNTMSYYLNLTPFSWVEIGYTNTLLRSWKETKEGQGPEWQYRKDRHVSLKLNPLKEGKWWPAIALGMDDPTFKKNKKNTFFANYYLVATKHLYWGRNEIGAHVAYRKFKLEYNEKWDGVVGGITFRPAFAPQLRAIVEYTGDGVNAGLDFLLLKHVFIQGGLQDGKYFSGGISFRFNLL